jgi:hypothetical protein
MRLRDGPIRGSQAGLEQDFDAVGDACKVSQRVEAVNSLGSALRLEGGTSAECILGCHALIMARREIQHRA